MVLREMPRVYVVFVTTTGSRQVYDFLVRLSMVVVTDEGLSD